MGKFKVGDRVKVKNIKVGTMSDAWRFNHEMSEYIGKELTIKDNYGDGVYRLDGLPYGWAEDWLEPVRNKEDIMEKFKVDDKVRVKKVEAGTWSHGHIFFKEMARYIGKKFTIAEDCGNGVYSFIGSPYYWAEDWLEPVRNKEDIMQKFEVGDRVRVKNIEVRKILHSHKFHPGMRKYLGKEFTIKAKYDDDTYRLDDIPYFWEPDLLESIKPEIIVIYRNGDKTVALDKATGKKAEAKCSGEDTYDFYTGAKIAFERLIDDGKLKEESKPKLYNGKVVCIKSVHSRITKGKIYKFTDGYSKYDNGSRMPISYDAVTSFEDLKKKVGSEFIELVEDGNEID